MKRLSTLALVFLFCACDPDPKVPESSPLAQAEALIKARDFAGAITVLEGARQTIGEDPAVVKRLVDLYSAKGDEARAIQRARAGLEAHPDANELYLPLANLYLGVKQIDPALTVLAEARRRGLDDAKVSMSTGTCLAHKGDTAGARTEYERARAAGADEQTASMNLALLLVHENKTEEALAAFEVISANHPKNAGAKRELARLLLARVSAEGKPGIPLDLVTLDRAMGMLGDVMDELKSDWRMHEAMGDGWLLLGDFDASLHSYTQALKLGQNPKSVEDRYRVAMKLRNEAQAAADASKPPQK